MQQRQADTVSGPVTAEYVNETAESTSLVSESSVICDTATEPLGVLLHEMTIAGEGVEIELELELGGNEQLPHLQRLLEAVVHKNPTKHQQHQQEGTLMQALPRLVPASAIHLSARLEPCSHTTAAALPKDARALLMRSLHHARLACSLKLDSSQLEAALMMLRPVMLGSWVLHDTAVNVVDVELQLDTAEGKDEPSVLVVCAYITIVLRSV